jgi:hypothetical protein
MAETPTPRSADRMTLDDLFDLLGSRWRRRAVLKLTEEPVDRTADEFVERLLADHDTNGDASSVELQFHHNHLPKLADAGVVDYDRQADVVAPGRNLNEVATVLHAVEEERSFFDRTR